MNADLSQNWNNNSNCMLKLDDTFSFLYAFSFNRGESMANEESFFFLEGGGGLLHLYKCILT